MKGNLLVCWLVLLHIGRTLDPLSKDQGFESSTGTEGKDITKNDPSLTQGISKLNIMTFSSIGFTYVTLMLSGIIVNALTLHVVTPLPSPVNIQLVENALTLQTLQLIAQNE